MISGVSATLPLAPAARAQPAAPAAGGGDFSAILDGLLDQTAAVLRQAETGAIAGIEGRIPVQAAVDQILAAERTLQAMIAIRDKAVGSYLEITRMQI